MCVKQKAKNLCVKEIKKYIGPGHEQSSPKPTHSTIHVGTCLHQFLTVPPGLASFFKALVFRTVKEVAVTFCPMTEVTLMA